MVTISVRLVDDWLGPEPPVELAPEDSLVNEASLEVTGVELLVRGYGIFELEAPVVILVGAVPEENGAVPVLEEYGAVPELVEYGAVPLLLEYGAVPVLFEYGAVPVLFVYGAVPVLFVYGAVPVLFVYGAVPDLLV